MKKFFLLALFSGLSAMIAPTVSFAAVDDPVITVETTADVQVAVEVQSVDVEFTALDYLLLDDLPVSAILEDVLTLKTPLGTYYHSYRWFRRHLDADVRDNKGPPLHQKFG